MTSPSPPSLGVYELRQYRQNPGTRDTLIRLFEEHFIESQEHGGSYLIGQFRDLGNPDRFVWIRGFADMAARTQALDAFYTSPIWLAHRPAANATIADHTDVLLLRPTGPGLGFRFGRGICLARLMTEPSPNGYPRLAWSACCSRRHGGLSCVTLTRSDGKGASRWSWTSSRASTPAPEANPRWPRRFARASRPRRRSPDA